MECEFGNQNAEGPASRTRSRKKRKIRPLQEVASASPPLKKGSGRSRHEDHQANSDQRIVQEKDSTKHEKQDLWSAPQSKPWLPEKRILELILDILQRRDSHEIFAEPVDPEEVEDYYEIIREPMDFGTMRAKLHEGMYQSFEQFEARAINELATKVFHLLKTHPERFELEFLESRRRNGRGPQGEAENSVCRTRPRIARNVKSSSVAIDESSKSTMSLSASSIIRKRAPLRNWCSGFSTYLDARDQEVSCGAGDDGRSRSIEAARRCTYEPWISFLDEKSSKKNQLELVIQQDISYRESLMLFAKDLGPVVQMVAGRKLLGWFPAQKSSFSMISSSNDGEPSSFDSVFSAPICQNFLDQIRRHPSIVENSRDRMDLDDDKKEEEMNIGDKMGTT
ncbi:Bromodomain and PHD finger-containing protein 3 [Morus notabilis]|uniref:Bromodomain and PHD finger-containing protein 3 n=1 Tax=Morus notabilis TaxID=981085 RepID=W9SKB2_9ROSA|nr:Bromodomain and PHD finger-containing protein 3 [Morus notabilis]